MEALTAAANVDRIKFVDLALKVHHAILKSANPGKITHMRSLEAIHQIYLFIYFIYVVLFGVSDLARFSYKGPYRC